MCLELIYPSQSWGETSKNDPRQGWKNQVETALLGEERVAGS